jgi:hypothetical protein
VVASASSHGDHPDGSLTVRPRLMACLKVRVRALTCRRARET